MLLREKQNEMLQNHKTVEFLILLGSQVIGKIRVYNGNYFIEAAFFLCF